MNGTPKIDVAMSVFLAPLVGGRRVLWIGEAGEGTDHLASRADLVRVLDTSGRGRRRGNAKVSIYRPGRLRFEAGSFDLAFVEDVALLEDAGARFEELATILGDGVLVCGARVASDEAVRLQESLADAFREVRLVGQAAFRGIALADLAASVAHEVCVDGSLLGDATESLETVFGIAADELPPVDPYLLVQVPSGPDRSAPDDELAARVREAGALREALERAESRLSQAQARLVATEGELAEARARLTESPPPSVESVEVELPADAPVPAVDAAPDADLVAIGMDVEALERKLRDRGARVRALEAEVAHARAVLRDVAEELREHQLGRRGGAPVASERSESSAPAADSRTDVEREVARAEAELRVDELSATLLARDRTLEALEKEHAALQGRVRGLRARAAEIEEMRQLVAARYEMSKLDVADNEERIRALEAQLADTREQLELALIRERGAPTRVTSTTELAAAADAEELAALRESERRLSERVGHLTGQLMRARERLADAEHDRDRARAESLRLTVQLGNLETRVEGLRMGYEMRIAMLTSEGASAAPTGTDEAIERELERLRTELEGLRGEREGLRLRLADAEASVAAADAKANGDALDELDRLREEVEALRQAEAELTVATTDLATSKSEAEARARDLVAAVASRDALVTRLQMDLADEEQRRRALDPKMERLRAERDRLRSALLDASGAVDRAEALARELDAARKQAKDARAACDVAEAKLTEAQRAADEAVSAAEARRSEEGEGVAQLTAERDALRAELEDARASAARLAGSREAERESLHALRRKLDAFRAEAPRPSVERSDITAVGLEAPTEDATVARLQREVDDKDTLLRSLTAQLEERNDRIRALERRLAEHGGAGGGGDDEDLRRTLLELQERVERLREELRHANDARQAAEDEVASLRDRPDPEQEATRLAKRLEEREAALEDALTRASVSERDVTSLRTVCSDARTEIESLLSVIADEDAAARLAALAEVLGTF